MIVSPGIVAEENPALPIAPIVSQGSTVAAALKLAQAWSARAVVELAGKVVRIHAMGTLQAAEQNGEGGRTLDRLPAIEVGRRHLEASGPLIDGAVVALGFALGALPDDLKYRPSIMAFQSPMFSGPIAGAVARAYKCPKDGEKFNGPGKCDLHDVDLEPADGT
jgi:hypothetical protein